MVTRLPWQPQCYVNNSFALSPIEVIFGMKKTMQTEWNRHPLRALLTALKQLILH